MAKEFKARLDCSPVDIKKFGRGNIQMCSHADLQPPKFTCVLWGALVNIIIVFERLPGSQYAQVAPKALQHHA